MHRKISSRRAALAVIGALLVAAAAIFVNRQDNGLAGTATVVNSTFDTTANDGVCTLREAIVSANTDTISGAASGECSGPDFDIIDFNIPMADAGYSVALDAWVIQPAPLPAVTSVVTIDGYTQPGAVENTLPLEDGTNAQPKIVLDGELQGVTALELKGGNSVVRGLVIQDWNFHAILVNTAGGNRIEGNFIGTDPTGTQRVEVNNGITLDSNNNIVGGPDNADRNLISGIKGNTAVFVDNKSNNLIQGNLIGTDATGTLEIHAGRGVGIENGASDNDVIGNVVSGNSVIGIAVFGAGNTLQGNLVGVSADQTASLPNGQYGILINGTNTLVGGPNPEDANVIAFNGGPGVFISSTGNTIQGNSTHSNTGLGIDFDGDGLTTPNDPGDIDGGTNNGQNYPEITSAQAGSAHVEGTFDSTPNTLFRLEVFANNECDPTDFGEGQTFLGEKDIMTDGDGVIGWDFDSAAALPADTYITATATNLTTGDTSEFSNCVLLAPIATPTPSPTATPSPTPSETAAPSETPTATPSPSPSPTPTPTASPTPTGTITPSPSPTPTSGPALIQGNVDCRPPADSIDALQLLLFVAHLPTNQADGCPEIDTLLAAFALVWGDVNCDGEVNSVDALLILLFVAHLPYTLPAGCPDIGEALS